MSRTRSAATLTRYRTAAGAGPHGWLARCGTPRCQSFAPVRSLGKAASAVSLLPDTFSELTVGSLQVQDRLELYNRDVGAGPESAEEPISLAPLAGLKSVLLDAERVHLVLATRTTTLLLQDDAAAVAWAKAVACACRVHVSLAQRQRSGLASPSRAPDLVREPPPAGVREECAFFFFMFAYASFVHW